MCMHTGFKKAFVAKKDIVCYKNADLFDNPGGKTKFQSAVRGFVYFLHEEYTLDKGARFPLDNEFYKYQSAIHLEEGFHSFKARKDAEDDINWCLENVRVVLKCVIPAGAHYWHGNWFWSRTQKKSECRQYCSDKIRIVAWKFRNEKTWREV